MLVIPEPDVMPPSPQRPVVRFSPPLAGDAYHGAGTKTQSKHGDRPRRRLLYLRHALTLTRALYIDRGHFV